MILGYNTPRPTAEQYIDFENKLVAGISKLGIEKLSLMLYGSYIRGDYIPGRSDIDAVLIFPDDVIIDKKNLYKTAVVLHQALRGNNIPFQVTVTDIATLKDGRFNSYDSSFKAYFEQEAKITGVDYRHKITYQLPTFNEQQALRFNLRKIRTGLFFSTHDIEEDYLEFLKKFNKSLDAISRGSKQILYLTDGQLRKNRFSALDEIRHIFPKVNIEPLQQICHLYQNPSQLDELYSNPADALRIWSSSVTFLEEMIKSYLEKCPKR